VTLRGFRYAQDDGSQEVLNVGGMSVTASCAAVNQLTVTLTSQVGASRLTSRSDSADSTDVGNNLVFTTLNSGESAAIVGGAGTNPDDDFQLGQTEFSAGDGRHVSLNWNASSGTTQGACVFIGTALVG
jgi:hypothetical protein